MSNKIKISKNTKTKTTSNTNNYIFSCDYNNTPFLDVVVNDSTNLQQYINTVSEKLKSDFGIDLSAMLSVEVFTENINDPENNGKLVIDVDTEDNDQSIPLIITKRSCQHSCTSLLPVPKSSTPTTRTTKTTTTSGRSTATKKEVNIEDTCEANTKRGSRCTKKKTNSKYCTLHAKSLNDNGDGDDDGKVEKTESKSKSDTGIEDIKCTFNEYTDYMRNNKKIPRNSENKLWTFGCKLVRSMNGLARGLPKKYESCLPEFRDTIECLVTEEDDENLTNDWTHFSTYLGSKKCTEEGCSKENASFNYPEWPSWGCRCNDHKEEGMVNVQKK